MPACAECEEIKPASQFPRGRPKCTDCTNATTYTWRERNPDKYRAALRRSAFKRKYGITPEDYDRMVAERGNHCDICGCPPDPEATRAEDRRLHVDHDHATGRIRGLLCRGCNLRLGWYEKHAESIDRYLAVRGG